MKDIKDFEGLYQISESGEVYSVRTGKFRHNQLMKRGYLMVMLSVNGKHYNKLIHRLVAETYIPNPLNLPEVNHIDGIKINCNVNNLEWTDRIGNNHHAVLTGLTNKGMKHGIHKLTDTEVMEIKMLKNKMRVGEIALKYNVVHSTISDILRGKRWTHINVRG